ncbi:MAG: hypothetical protein ABIV13_05350, partial [Fimbriimonadales bacterium]
MVALIALVALAPFQDGALDPKYMQVGAYIAASRVEDRQALGGFGSSHRFHTRVSNSFLGTTVNARLVANPHGLSLHLSN